MATLTVSSLRSVWSEAMLTYISPSTANTKVSTSPEDSTPSACTVADWVSWFSAIR
ncbi:hypothetical protein D3C71_2166020 [compost metagenome]